MDQTGPKGRPVTKVYVEKFEDVRRFFYAGMVIDSAVPAITLLISEIINEDIVNVASKQNDKILRVLLPLNQGIDNKKIMEVLDFLSLDKTYLRGFQDFFGKLLFTFINLDARMIEINPVGTLPDKTLVALDAKIDFDDNALFRHPDIARMREVYEYDQRTRRAMTYGFQYVEFDGNIGCITNGEGLALEAMDLLKENDLTTACLLNIKGSVDRDKIADGIKIIMTNPRVEGILINILGGFLRCNLLAEGILIASQDVGLNMPLIVRFEGTNREEAKNILQQSKLPIIFADNLGEAVQKLSVQMKDDS